MSLIDTERPTQVTVSPPPRERPRVSIGLPVYNGERFLAAAIESLLAQDFGDFELLLADNASTDATRSICEHFAERDNRVRLLASDVNRGASWNFNRVVEAARGEFFKWAADDDLYDPGFVSGCVAVLDNRPDVVVCFTQALEIDPEGAVFDERGPINVAAGPTAVERYRAVLFEEVYCYAVFGLIRMDVLRNTGLIGPYTTSDRVLLAELALHGRFFERNEAHFFHREHPGRSMYAFADDRDRVGWFDTSRDGSRAMPRWRIGVEYAQSIRRSGPAVGAWTQLRAMGPLGRWFLRNRVALARELVRAAILRGRDVVARR